MSDRNTDANKQPPAANEGRDNTQIPPHEQPEMSKTAARQGRNVPMVWHVLVISTLAAFLVLAVIYLLVPWPSEAPAPDAPPALAPEQVQPPDDRAVEPEAVPPAPADPPPAQ